MRSIIDTVIRIRRRIRMRAVALCVLDAAVVLIATLFAYYARFEFTVPSAFVDGMSVGFAAAVVVYLGVFFAFGLYRIVLRFVGVDTLLRLTAAVTLAFATLVALDLVASIGRPMRLVPVGVLAVQAVVIYLGSAALRLSVRVFSYLENTRATSGRRVLIVGAGNAGTLLLRDIRLQPDLGLHVLGFLDDARPLQGRDVAGVKVIGTTAELERLVIELEVEEIFVAMPSASSDTVRSVLNRAADINVSTRIMPALVAQRAIVGLTDLRKVEVEDLLGRDPAPIDVSTISPTIAGKVVAVTGAAGSIGSELCRQILELKPKRLLLIEIDESRLYELWLELTRIDPVAPVMCIADVRDASKLENIFAHERPSIVLHAAAYKHVPMMELSPDEAVKANVLGTRLVLEACERHGCERFVLVSTDKAVEPTTVMGATKAIAEGLAMMHTRPGGLNVCAVRFGNVLDSRGSVIPLFEAQLRRGGPLLVTHPDATRYFMTIPEASRLVLQAQAISAGGDIFVLDMGQPVRILDLAKKMIALSGVPAEIEFIGLRPAEKLHEILTSRNEALVESGHPFISGLNALPLLSADFQESCSALEKAAAAGDSALVVELLAQMIGDDSRTQLDAIIDADTSRQASA